MERALFIKTLNTSGTLGVSLLQDLMEYQSVRAKLGWFLVQTKPKGA